MESDQQQCLTSTFLAYQGWHDRGLVELLVNGLVSSCLFLLSPFHCTRADMIGALLNRWLWPCVVLFVFTLSFSLHQGWHDRGLVDSLVNGLVSSCLFLLSPFHCTRADVLITQPIEEVWRTRNFDSIDKIKWTNVGLRSGVFRTYPGHRSTRGYDPTQWGPVLCLSVFGSFVNLQGSLGAGWHFVPIDLFF